MNDLHMPSGRRPHVLIFPLPAQSHVNTMLKLAEQLCLASGIDVTFLISDWIHNQLLQHTEVLSKRFHRFKLKTITDGLPEDHPRCGENVTDMFHSIRAVTSRVFRDMVVSGQLGRGSGRVPITCIIADGVMSFTVDVAKEVGVPCILFRTVSASCFWAYSCIPRLIEAGHLPFKGNDSSMPINDIPGMEGCLRQGDLPGFCRCSDLDDATLQYVIDEAQRNFRADGLMFNTFEELESPVLDRIRGKIPRLYAVGPLHAHLKPSRSGDRKENRECMVWLDNQPARSVVYVSFGSVAVLTADRFLELWHGLVNSRKRFLWVVRPGSISGKGWTGTPPDELVKATGAVGHLVEWAPQEEVLIHPAVGAFLTHAGWNSVLESMTAGVPMICWPCYADQFLNSRFVSEVWKVGLDLKDTERDRVAVERAVRELLDERQDEFRGSAEKMKKFAASRCGNKSLGGSTTKNSLPCLDRLIQDVRTMCLERALLPAKVNVQRVEIR